MPILRDTRPDTNVQRALDELNYFAAELRILGAYRADEYRHRMAHAFPGE